MNSFKPLIFSGIQPTGHLQLGNYLGAIKRFVEFQKNYECLYCVADMHALTTNPRPEILLQNTRKIAAAFIAAGIDSETTIIFNQSRVLQHAELAWVFNCIARIGWMNRMTQFKDKAGKDREKASLGLFAYPSLMAADILLYRATHVPVGEDQRQHLELTRDIAQKFNHDYSEQIARLNLGRTITEGDHPVSGFFPMVEPMIEGDAIRIMSLRDGKIKMSKSDPSDLSRINLDDTPDDIAQKIRKAKTDSAPLPETIEELSTRPEANNLVNIYAALAQKDKTTILAEFAGKNFSVFKPALIELLITELAPVSAHYKALMQESDFIDTILQKGADHAQSKAEETMKQVRHIVGFI